MVDSRTFATQASQQPRPETGRFLRGHRISMHSSGKGCREYRGLSYARCFVFTAMCGRIYIVNVANNMDGIVMGLLPSRQQSKWLLKVCDRLQIIQICRELNPLEHYKTYCGWTWFQLKSLLELNNYSQVQLLTPSMGTVKSRLTGLRRFIAFGTAVRGLYPGFVSSSGQYK